MLYVWLKCTYIQKKVVYLQYCQHNQHCLHYYNIFPAVDDGCMGKIPPLKEQNYSDDWMDTTARDTEICFPSLGFVQSVLHELPTTGENETRTRPLDG